ncbi:MAG: hypothetical protein OHK0024_16890 [Thalassobaculales bacterium]
MSELALALARLPLWLTVPGALASGILLVSLAALAVRLATGIAAAAPQPAGAAALLGPLEAPVEGRRKFMFVSQLFAMLLGFLFAGEAARYFSLQESVALEANALAALSQQAGALPGLPAARIRAAAGDYARTIVEDEWPRLSRGQDSPATERALARLTAAVAEVVPQSPREVQVLGVLWSRLGEAQQRRAERLARAGGTLPNLISLVLVVATGVALLFTATMGSTLGVTVGGVRIVLGSLLAGVILLEVLGIVQLSHPFSGDIAIGPAPFRALGLGPPPI